MYNKKKLRDITKIYKNEITVTSESVFSAASLQVGSIIIGAETHEMGP